VIADPELMASQPAEALVASAMNALAHAMEALYTPRANPVSELAALRGAELLGSGLRSDPLGRDEVALGALLAGFARPAPESPSTTRRARRSCARQARRTQRRTR
jgi:maleylacetate reductase